MATYIIAGIIFVACAFLLGRGIYRVVTHKGGGCGCGGGCAGCSGGCATMFPPEEEEK